MAVTWVLLANGVAGRVLEIKNNKEIFEAKNFSHPRTAKKDVIKVLENPEALAAGIKNMPVTPAIDYSGEMEKHERQVFAKEIANYIIKSFGQNRFNKLIVVASRQVLGELRKEWPNTVKKLIEHELDKDFLAQKLSDEELLAQIRDDLGLLSF